MNSDKHPHKEKPPSKAHSPARDYHAQAVMEEGRLADVRLTWPGREWRLLGRGGALTETRILTPLKQDISADSHIPVLVGSGLGHALEELLSIGNGPVVVIDKEKSILALTGLRNRYSDHPGLVWLDDADPDEVVLKISRLQMQQAGKPLLPIPNPVYLRLDRDYYQLINLQLKASKMFNFWSRADYPRFREDTPRVLLITSDYFLLGEVSAACSRMGVPCRMLNLGSKEMGCSEFIEELLSAVISFKPDFALTINHLGVDREGALMELLGRLRLPLASWFVDNPSLILYLYNKVVSPWTAIFTWDADNVATMREKGFEHVFYLPLGCDPNRFKPLQGVAASGHPLRAQVSFVGNSMRAKVAARMRAGRFPGKLLRAYREIAVRFSEHPERSVGSFLEANYPELLPEFEGLGTIERKLAFETMITWEATRSYRQDCVERILPFNPLIIGDRHWKSALRKSGHHWRYHRELSYYDQLPLFYPLSDVNFNCTSRQMKGAVNQRVFDVPACGAFLLTDSQEQMFDMFEPGREVAFYSHASEIPELVDYYLRKPDERRKISAAARTRILREHTYDLRLRSLFRTMRDIYS